MFTPGVREAALDLAVGSPPTQSGDANHSDILCPFDMGEAGGKWVVPAGLGWGEKHR